MAHGGNEIFPSPRDTVSQSVPCFGLPSTKSNSDTEYGSEFPISCLLAILIDNKCPFFPSFFLRTYSSGREFESFLNKPYSFEGVQMGVHDTALTPVSKISLAAASHLLNTPDLRKPSDAAFTATLSSGAHAIGRCALALDNSTGHLGKLECWFSPPGGQDICSLSPLWWLCSYGQLKYLLLCWVYQIGRKRFFFLW